MKTPPSEDRPDPSAQKSTHKALKQLKLSFIRNQREEDVCEVKETYGLLYIKNRNIILMGSAH